MANEIRLRQNFVGGLIDDSPLTADATTLTSGGLSVLVAVDNTSHVALILDPDGIYGDPEIVWVTAHAATSSLATILRGQEGTTPRVHQRDVPWVHSATTVDFQQAAGNAQVYVPTQVQSYFAEATGGTPTQTITGQTFATVICPTEVTDLGNRYDPATGFYSVPVSGVYECEGQWRASTDAALNGLNIGVGIHSTNTDVASFVWRTLVAGTIGAQRHTLVYRRQAYFAAGDLLRFYTYVDNTGSYILGARRVAFRLVATEV